MEIENLLWAALQSSFLLGLLHGVNPCGHSWLVLAPFVTGEKKGSRVFLLTVSFLAGTAVACLLLGATLGAVSQVIPASMGFWVEVITAVILMIVGLLLIYDPHLLHNHDHEHDHGHSCDGHHHDHEDCCHGDHDHDHHACCEGDHDHDHHHHGHGIMRRVKALMANQQLLPVALFTIGFINMIVPCPTAVVMYTYALNAGSVWNATLVFGSYAVSTAIAVGAVIFLIFKATQAAHSLQKEWVEPFIMRFTGVIIILFSAYGIFHSLVEGH